MQVACALKDGAILVQYSISFFAASAGIALVPSCAATVPATATAAEKNNATIRLFVVAIVISLCAGAAVPPRAILAALSDLQASGVKIRLRTQHATERKIIGFGRLRWRADLAHIAGMAERVAAG